MRKERKYIKDGPRKKEKIYLPKSQKAHYLRANYSYSWFHFMVDGGLGENEIP